MGKSKLAIDIIKEIDPDKTFKVLLLTNSETLRDINWKAEFEKFGLIDYYNSNVASECYQTVYRWENHNFDLVIGDELDFALTPMYSQFFLKNTYKSLLGLTGFCSEDKKELLNQIAPIVFEYTTQQGQENNLLNQSEIILVKYPLSKERNIKVNMRNGGYFSTSENANYIYYDKAFNKALYSKSALEKKQRMGLQVEESAYNKADWTFKMMATKRKAILNNSESSIKLTNAIIENIHSRSDNKVLVFSALTNQADKLGYPTYHGKATSTEKGLDRLNSGEINTLVVCKAINRGVNLVGVNYLIRESFDSSETDFMQTHGRLMRLKLNQVAKYIILIPQFEDLVRLPTGSFKKEILPTQAGKWAEKMMDSINPNNVSVLELDSTLKLPQGCVL